MSLPFTYVSGAFNPELYPILYDELKGLVKEYYQVNSHNGQSYLAKRVSCVFGDEKELPYQGELAGYDWSKSRVVNALRDYLTDYFKTKFDYCLAHIYRDGSDKISAHRDKESLNTVVVSISFGATRKFQLRLIDQAKGWTHEYSMKNGDMIIMWPGCQKKYLHWILEEKKIKEPRINLTFRVVTISDSPR